jgi:hypothetical protein
MNLPSQLPVEVLEEIVTEIQRLLWLDMSAEGEFWNANKEWDAETLEYIAAVLQDHGLRPSETPIDKPTRG